jgi:hypothetical protein
MSAEHNSGEPIPIEAIHYYPKDKRLVIDVEGGPSFSLTQAPEGLFYQLLLDRALTQPPPAPLLEEAQAPQQQEPQEPVTPASATVEPVPAVAKAAGSPKKENQLILTGRLKEKPRPGQYPDSRGKPTATALFAANVEGRDDAWMLSATFLRATREVALSLNQDDQITVEGFVNKHKDPTKKDMYSVFRFIHHPNMPPKHII